MISREKQAPIKRQYRDDPGAAMITSGRGGRGVAATTGCSVDIGRAVYEAKAHAGVGGSGVSPCSGDLLLGALAACAQITCQMVAASQGAPVERVRVTVEGDLDLRGTLGVARSAPVGFAAIRVAFDIDAPEATEKQRRRCVGRRSSTAR